MNNIKYAVHDERVIKGFFNEYRFLSNYDAAPVWFNGLLYPTTENAYQAAKCYLESDRRRFTEISPAEAKALGQVVPIVNQWDQIKLDVMAEITMQKYARHLSQRARLLATGERYLEETNHWGDRYWGVCQGVGENWLGKILMITRSMFRSFGDRPVKSMTVNDFLNYIADNKPEPWAGMAANMLIFGVNKGGVDALRSTYPVNIIDAP